MRHRVAITLTTTVDIDPKTNDELLSVLASLTKQVDFPELPGLLPLLHERDYSLIADFEVVNVRPVAVVDEDGNEQDVTEEGFPQQ